MPEKYKGDLRYHKIEEYFDPDLEIMVLIESLLYQEILAYGPHTLILQVATWEGSKRYKISDIPKEELDQAIEWLSSLDILKVVEAQIVPSSDPCKIEENSNALYDDW